jgi:hypothetical protein
MKKINIELNGKEFEVQSAPLTKLLEALKVLKAYPDKIKGIDFEDKQANVAIMIDLISTSSEEIFGILSSLSGIPTEEISVLDLADTLGLVNALLKVNDIERIKKDSGEIAQMFNQKAKK